MSRCIVTFATHDPRYEKNLIRQGNTFAVHKSDDVTYLVFTNYDEIGSPTHQDNNYAFKVYAIQKAIDLGFTTVLWVDSAVYSIAPFAHIFEYIEKEGLLMFDNIGYSVNDFCNEKLTRQYHLSIDLKKSWKMIMACVMGFDFTKDHAQHCFNLYKQDCEMMLFNGSWADHRHDQTSMSIALYRAGLQNYIIRAQDTFFAYKAHLGKIQVSENVCLLSASY